MRDSIIRKTIDKAMQSPQGRRTFAQSLVSHVSGKPVPRTCIDCDLAENPEACYQRTRIRKHGDCWCEGGYLWISDEQVIGDKHAKDQVEKG